MLEVTIRRANSSARRHFLRPNGFTVIELMITVLLLALLLAIAAPSLREFVLQQRVKAALSEFHRGVTLARAEAIRRNQRVTLAAADSSCSDFGQGWRIFYDGQSGPTANQCFDSSETQVMLSPALDSVLTVTWRNADANKPYLIFTPTGGVSMANGAVGASSWSVAVPSVPSIQARTLCINFYGRTRTLSGSSTCSASG